MFNLNEPFEYDAHALAELADSVVFAAPDVLGQISHLDPDRTKSVTAIVAVPVSASVADAHAALAKEAEAKDVFVTEDGSRTGKVLGWLTNSDLPRSV